MFLIDIRTEFLTREMRHFIRGLQVQVQVRVCFAFDDDAPTSYSPDLRREALLVFLPPFRRYIISTTMRLLQMTAMAMTQFVTPQVRYRAKLQKKMRNLKIRVCNTENITIYTLARRTRFT